MRESVHKFIARWTLEECALPPDDSNKRAPPNVFVQAEHAAGADLLMDDDDLPEEEEEEEEAPHAPADVSAALPTATRPDLESPVV